VAAGWDRGWWEGVLEVALRGFVVKMNFLHHVGDNFTQKVYVKTMRTCLLCVQNDLY
jgi:hypothetical protein